MGLASAIKTAGKIERQNVSKAISRGLGKGADFVKEAYTFGAKNADEVLQSGSTKGINKHAGIFKEEYEKSAKKWANIADDFRKKGDPNTINLGTSAEKNINKNSLIQEAANSEETSGLLGGTPRRNTVYGSIIGGVGGAGLSGLTGVATGADEDNQKALTVGGAIGGAIIGGFTGRVLGGSRINKTINKTVKEVTNNVDENIKNVAKNVATKSAVNDYSGVNHAHNLNVVNNVATVSNVPSVSVSNQMAKETTSDIFDSGLKSYNAGYVGPRGLISGNAGPALLTDSNIVADVVSQDITPKSHRLNGTMSLPGAISLGNNNGMIAVG